MDRLMAKRLGMLGVGALLAASGCNSAWHRRGIPPEPPRTVDGGAAQFSSDPHMPSAAATPPGPAGALGPVGGGGAANPGARGGMYGPSNEPGGPPATSPGTTPSMGGNPVGSMMDAPNL